MAIGRSILSFARVCRIGAWFGFVRSALLLAVGTCCVLSFEAMPGLCCFLRVTHPQEANGISQPSPLLPRTYILTSQPTQPLPCVVSVYRRCKGRSRCMAERISTHTNPMQPQTASHHCSPTRTASLHNQLRHCLLPVPMPHHENQHRHCKTSIIAETLLTRNNKPSPAVHLSSPPLHRHRQQRHCPVHKLTLGMRPLSAAMSPRRLKNYTASFPMYPHVSTAKGTNRKAATPSVDDFQRHEFAPIRMTFPRAVVEETASGSVARGKACIHARRHAGIAKSLPQRRHRHAVSKAPKLHNRFTAEPCPMQTKRFTSAREQ